MSELLIIFHSYSNSVILISFVSFSLTYLVKLIIYKTNLVDSVNKNNLNIITIVIPLLLAFLITIFHSGVYLKIFNFKLIISNAIKSWTFHCHFI